MSVTATRRDWLLGVAAAAAVAACGHGAAESPAPARPNVILVMADDLGYGDLGYMGNPNAQTPHLDAMAREGVRLDRFYAAAPVCSPTRASCLTGRHPYRMNIPWASDGHLPAGEATLAETLRDAGYRTGHFGKWHLGGLSKTVKQSYFPGPVNPAQYAPPWEHGFETCFSTESMMPTYNPYYHVGGEYGSDAYRYIQNQPVAAGQRDGGFRWRDFYWTGPGRFADEWLEGDDSKLIMDRAIDFMGAHAAAGQPFLSVIWFHTPHTPVVAGNDDRAPFDALPMDAQHWYGAIAAMDRQIGRLRTALRDWSVANNTILWFCSDNGPSYIHEWGSAGSLRGEKGTLYEGGVRVPAIVEWPDGSGTARVVEVPVVTSDIFPTVLAVAGVDAEIRPLDGENVLPILRGVQAARTNPIAFQSPMRGARWEKLEGQESLALVDGNFKAISLDGGATYSLYDLARDPAESADIAADHPERLAKMAAYLNRWSTSCAASATGADY